MAHDVFISYARDEDEKTAARIREALKSRGIECWMAPHSIPPGKDYAEAIIDAISATRVMVVVISSGANASKHIVNEIENADNRDITIIPFRVENVALSKSLQYYLSRRHWLDATSPPIEARINELTDTIERLLSSPKDGGHTRTTRGTIDTAITATSTNEAVSVVAATVSRRVHQLWFWLGLLLLVSGIGWMLIFLIVAAASQQYDLEPDEAFVGSIPGAFIGILLLRLSRRKWRHLWFWPGVVMFVYGLVGIPTWMYIWRYCLDIPDRVPGTLAFFIGVLCVPFIFGGAFCLERGWPRAGVKHPRGEAFGFIGAMLALSLISVLWSVRTW
jgi:hypothetical protein